MKVTVDIAGKERNIQTNKGWKKKEPFTKMTTWFETFLSTSVLTDSLAALCLYNNQSVIIWL